MAPQEVGMRSQVLGNYSALQVYCSEKVTWLRQCIEGSQRNRIIEYGKDLRDH